MAKFASTDATLAVETTPGGGTYGLVAAGITHSMSIDNGVTDTSDKDQSRWGSEASYGKRVVTIPVEGFVTDDNNFALIEAAVEAGTASLNFQYSYGDSKTITGAFSISAFNYDATNFDAQKCTFTLTNNGTPTFA